MPVYEYECKGCYARFEIKQSITDDPVKECPTCQGAVRRVIHPVGIVFKGSGFYATDHARGGNRPSSEETPVNAEASKKEEKKEPAAAGATAGETKKDS